MPLTFGQTIISIPKRIALKPQQSDSPVIAGRISSVAPLFERLKQELDRTRGIQVNDGKDHLEITCHRPKKPTEEWKTTGKILATLKRHGLSETQLRLKSDTPFIDFMRQRSEYKNVPFEFTPSA